MRRPLLFPFGAALAVMAAIAFARPEPSALAEDAAAPEFVSQKNCKKCHFKEHKSWKDTVHAKAMDVLKPGERAEAKQKANLDPTVDYTKDAKCVKCHVAGYGQPGGYPEIKETWTEEEQKLAADNTGVGCEMCHGAGSLYAAYKSELNKTNEQYKRPDIVAKGLLTPVTAEACTKCHNEESPTHAADATFDFEAAKKDAKAIHEHVELKYPH